MATATIQVAYEAETSSLKATVNEINQINDKVVEGAQKAAKQSADAFKKVGESITGAFAGENVKKALNNINLESLKLVKTLPKVGAEVIKLANTAADIGKLEEQLRDLALAGKSNTAEFDKIAKAVGTYKASITLADRAIEAYAKSTDAASSRIGILEDKLYDLAIAGQQDTQEFKELIAETTKLKRAIFETDQQVDSFVERGRKLNTVVQNVQLVGAAFQAVEGVSAAFGQENEELQKTLDKLNAVLAITGALEQARAILIEQSAKKTGIAAIAQSGYNAVVGTSNGLLKAFRLALAGTGIGVLVLAITELISYFNDLQAQSAKTQTVFDRFKDTFANAKIAIEGYRDSIINAQERIDVSLGKTSKIQADVNRQRREDTTKLGKELAPLIVAQEKLRTEYEKELAIVNSPAFKVSSDERIQALLKSEKIGKELAIVEAEVSRVRTEGRAAINATTKALVEEEKATQRSKDEKEKNKNKIKETRLEYVKLSETLDEYTKKQRDAIKIETELTDINLKTAEESFQSRIFFLQAEQAAGDKSLETRINIIKAEGEARKAALELNEDFANRSKIINAETQAAITKEISDETDKRIELAIKYANAVVSVFNSINELNKVNSENRIAEITATSEAELNGINSSLDLERDKQRQRLALEKRTAQAIANEKTKQARADKALAIFQATIAVAVQVIQNLKNPILAAFIGAAGAIQIGALAAKPLPKFEKGGLIGGKLHSQGGTLIEAEQGEYMVNRRQSAKHRRELDAMNTSTEAFRRMIDEKYVRPALMSYSAGRRGKEGVVVNASLNSKSMEKELRAMRKDLKARNVVVNINQQDSRYSWQ
jgi:hypothetical protein